jgi:4-alpha-glucanotransferase
MPGNATLEMLASAVGLLPEWQDINGKTQHVAPETLRQVLTNFGITANTTRQISTALKDHQRQASSARPGCLTAASGGTLVIPGMPSRAKVSLLLEGDSKERACATSVDHGAGRIRVPRRPGYHRLRIGNQEIVLAVAPKQAVTCSALTGHHPSWGLAAQLYSLRNGSTEGVGDFVALQELSEQAGKAGASALAISPLHAQFSADGGHFSPYSPSSRLWLNVFHLNVAAAYHALGCDPTRVTGRSRRKKAAGLIDWPELTERKLQQLAHLFHDLKQAGKLAADHATGQALLRFTQAGSTALQHHALFETLHAHFLAHSGTKWHWRSWPPAFRSPASEACQAFAREHAGQIDFHVFLQWLAHCQLGDVAASCRKSMAIGLISDIAVGSDGGGSEAWAERAFMLDGFSAGAPPDAFNMSGQNWGVTTFSPRGLQDGAYRPFIDLLRASLQYAGGARLDHILGLARLWVIPSGARAVDGVYLRYPLADLLRLAALESHRHNAFILGEDLGTVPDGFRDQLRLKGISGMQVLWFQRRAGTFLPAKDWSPEAVGMTTTHDLPTIAGWWRGTDLRWRKKLTKAPVSTARQMDAKRKVDRALLWDRIRKSSAQAIPPAATPEVVIDSVVEHLSRTACSLVLLPLEDAMGLTEQPNLPGTIDQHPNWRRQLPMSVDEIFRMPAVTRRLRMLRRRRPLP